MEAQQCGYADATSDQKIVRSSFPVRVYLPLTIR
jgi:hypothetical protein